jgi:hypothetical protein
MEAALNHEGHEEHEDYKFFVTFVTFFVVKAYSATMVSCGTTLMNGENVAVRPKRSVAVTV